MKPRESRHRIHSNVSSGSSIPAKTVRFELAPDSKAAAEVRRNPPRPSRTRRKRPPVPTWVYGFYLPDANVRSLGRRMIPEDDSEDSDPDVQEGFLRHMGVCFANAHCQTKFPHIPLCWRAAMLVRTDVGEAPIIALGHQDSRDQREIFVTEEAQLKQLRDYLGLGDQQPGWYRVVCSG